MQEGTDGLRQIVSPSSMTKDTVKITASEHGLAAAWNPSAVMFLWWARQALRGGATFSRMCLHGSLQIYIFSVTLGRGLET